MNNGRAFDQAVSHYIDSAIAEQKETYHSTLEPFESYANKFRKRATEELDWFKTHFYSGYKALLDEIQPALNPDETLDPFLMAPEKLSQINSHEKFFEFLAEGKSFHQLFGYSEKVLNAFYKAAYKMVDDRHFEEGFNAYLFLVTVAPHLREAWLNFGFISCQLGDFLSGIEAYGRARDLNPKKADSYLAVSGTYLKMRNYEYAHKACDIGIDFAREYDEPWAHELIKMLNEAKRQMPTGD